MTSAKTFLPLTSSAIELRQQGRTSLTGNTAGPNSIRLLRLFQSNERGCLEGQLARQIQASFVRQKGKIGVVVSSNVHRLTLRKALLSYSVKTEATLKLKQLTVVTPFLLAALTVVAAHKQQGQWAAADDPTAKFIVDSERQWAEAACTHNKITEEILADDFQGTSPEGKRYAKQQEVAEAAHSSKTARDCRLIDANVRFFGDSLATVYGSESSIRKAKDGTEKPRCVIWTDTWLKRNGKWQIIAAQDTQFNCK